MPLTAFAKQELTVSTSVVSFDSNIFAKTGETPAQRAVVSVDYGEGAIRFWYHPDSAEPPSSTSGHEALPGQTFVLEGADNIKNFRAIRRDDVDAKLTVTFER